MYPVLPVISTRFRCRRACKLRYNDHIHADLFTGIHKIMTQPIKSWLKGQISSIDSVRAVVIDPAGHLVAHTWSSGVVHIYLLEELPKARMLKKILQDNTRVGIGSLFLIKAELAPPDGTQAALDESLISLHALYRDRFYTYGVAAGKPRIGQVHLKTFNTRGDEREVWYGPDVVVRNLPNYRVWVTVPSSMKGSYLVANFGNEAFWKDADYNIGRDAFRREQRKTEPPPRYYTWSGWQEVPGQAYQAPVDPPVYSTPETELDRAYALLGVKRGATANEVKMAFRQLARQVHPDVSTLPKAEAEARFKKLNDAYMKIKAANGW